MFLLLCDGNFVEYFHSQDEAIDAIRKDYENWLEDKKVYPLLVDAEFDFELYEIYERKPLNIASLV